MMAETTDQELLRRIDKVEKIADTQQETLEELVDVVSAQRDKIDSNGKLISDHERRIKELEHQDPDPGPQPPPDEWQQIFYWDKNSITPAEWGQARDKLPQYAPGRPRGDHSNFVFSTGTWNFPPNYEVPEMLNDGRLKFQVKENAYNHHTQLRIISNELHDGFYFKPNHRYRVESVWVIPSVNTFKNTEWSALIDHLGSNPDPSTPAMYIYGDVRPEASRHNVFMYYVTGDQKTPDRKNYVETHEDFASEGQEIKYEFTPCSYNGGDGYIEWIRNDTSKLLDVNANTRYYSKYPEHSYAKFGLYSTSHKRQYTILEKLEVMVKK